MFIKVENLRDFKCFIIDLIENDETNIRVFSSSRNVVPAGVGWDREKTHTKFVLAIFSPIYQVIYSDTIKNEDYDNLFGDLIDFRDERELPFKIQQFESIKIVKEPPHIIVEKELDTI